MPTNTAQNDSAEPLKTADLPVRYSENAASAATSLRTPNGHRHRHAIVARDPLRAEVAVLSEEDGEGCAASAAAFPESGVSKDEGGFGENRVSCDSARETSREVKAGRPTGLRRRLGVSAPDEKQGVRAHRDDDVRADGGARRAAGDEHVSREGRSDTRIRVGAGYRPWRAAWLPASEAVGFTGCRPSGLRPFRDGSELHCV